MTSHRLIRFSSEDLALFSRASGDRNPLHLSAAYAAKTAFGQQVVFGALGSLASLAVADTTRRVARITSDFLRPMFLNVDYRLDVSEEADAVAVRLLDGSTPVLQTSLHLAGKRTEQPTDFGTALFPRERAQVLQSGDVSVGSAVNGSYFPDLPALRELCARWSSEAEVIPAIALLWSSYLVGMELPGESALFFRLALDFPESTSLKTICNTRQGL